MRYFLDAATAMRMTLRVQLSSCVPATALETSGARLDAADLILLRDHPAVLGLAEMMNFPGVLARDDAVLDKLVAFAGWHVDGHAPLVRGYDLNAYLAAAIRTDHESTGFAEGQEKLGKGMCVLMREGSIAKDVAALAPLLTEATWPFVAFCTDDRNPLEILDEGHVDFAIRKAIARRRAAARGVSRGQLRRGAGVRSVRSRPDRARAARRHRVARRSREPARSRR